MRFLVFAGGANGGICVGGYNLLAHAARDASAEVQAGYEWAQVVDVEAAQIVYTFPLPVQPVTLH